MFVWEFLPYCGIRAIASTSLANGCVNRLGMFIADYRTWHNRSSINLSIRNCAVRILMKTHEQIVINGNIVVTVMNIRGTRVSLGIEAPAEVRILRCELEPRAAEPTPPHDSGDAAALRAPVAP
jgi:carbon storage regulator CsrA